MGCARSGVRGGFALDRNNFGTIRLNQLQLHVQIDSGSPSETSTGTSQPTNTDRNKELKKSTFTLLGPGGRQRTFIHTVQVRGHCSVRCALVWFKKCISTSCLTIWVLRRFFFGSCQKQYALKTGLNLVVALNFHLLDYNVHMQIQHGKQWCSYFQVQSYKLTQTRHDRGKFWSVRFQGE